MKPPLSLIVDDVAAVRAYLRILLQRDGFETVEAADGREALDLVRKLGTTIDLVISDVQMPFMDGLALTAAIRAEFPYLPIVLVTGYADDLQIDVPVVRKPFARETLLRAASSAMSKRRAASA